MSNASNWLQLDEFCQKDEPDDEYLPSFVKPSDLVATNIPCKKKAKNENNHTIKKTKNKRKINL